LCPEKTLDSLATIKDNVIMPRGQPCYWETSKLEELAKLYSEGQGLWQLARHYGASTYTVRGKLIELGVQIRIPCERVISEKGLTKEIATNLYWDEKLSIPEIAKRFKVFPTTLYRFFRLRGIPTRSGHEVRKLTFSKKPQPKGELSPHWKGGRFKQGRYVMIYAPDHYRARPGTPYAPEHLVVWERTHGKRLPDGWQIHHLNGITDDNRPENLIALPSRQHILILRELKNRIRQLEAEIRELKSSRQLTLQQE
jgi:hypothetical protein